MRSDAAIAVNSSTHVAQARRVALDLARNAGMPDDACGNCALVVTELATNLLKHAREGTLVLCQLEGPALEVLSLDNGPGIRDTDRCFTDQYSTGSTPGTGLGAVRRLSSFQDIYSVPGRGTAIMARMGKASRKVANLGAISVPYPGEEECGDAWELQDNGERLALTMADGLGHGDLAAQAARRALAVAGEHAFLNPDELIRLMHPALRDTRGAAVSSALCHLSGNLLEYAGVGNVSGSITGGNLVQQRMVTMNGTAGLEIRKVQTFRYSWESGSFLIMHTDGLSAKWSLDQYPGLLATHPALIAGVLFRDHRRMHDDATVVAVRL